MNREITCPYCNSKLGKLPLKDFLEIRSRGMLGQGTERDIRCKKCNNFFDIIVWKYVESYKKGEID